MVLNFSFLNQLSQPIVSNINSQKNVIESSKTKKQNDLFNLKNSSDSITDTFTFNSFNKVSPEKRLSNPISSSIFAAKPVETQSVFEKSIPQKPIEPKPVLEQSLLQKSIDTVNIAKSFVNLINLKDNYTGIHSQKVQNYSDKFAQKLNLSKNDAEAISLGAAFHDIGKIGIPESILNSKSQLSDEEFKKIQEHPVLGAKIIEGVPEFKGKVSKIVKHHHENWDGTGYPDNLSGENIPLGARVIAIADSYHAMTSDRPYRKGLPIEKAVEILKDGAGKQWDPALVDKFIQTIPELK